MVKHAAFTFIELIFAIVIIAIAVVSLPMMNQAISKGTDANLVQEAIFASATELNEAVGAHWDDNSLEPNNPSSFARVIDIGPIRCENNSSLSSYRRMPGHITQKKHRKCLDNPLTGLSAVNIATVNSLNDMNHSSQQLFINNTQNAKGYKNEYSSTLSVTSPSNFNGNNNNIKELVVTVMDKDNVIITRLRTYSANIGEIDYEKRTY